MKILITGAGGFIGSSLIKQLVTKLNTEVFCVLSANANKEEVEKINYLFLDLSTDSFENNLPESVDIVVHLAQSNSYRNFPEKARDVFNINVGATQILLDWSIKAGVKKFIYASTGNVYLQQNKKLNENDSCDAWSYYGATKYAAEQIMKPYHKYFNTIAVRIFGVYGPGQKNMMIPNIINKVLKSEEITLAKDVGLYFTPLYISDCVQMFLKLIFSDSINHHQVFNFSGSEIVNLGELVKIVSKETKTNPKITIVDTEPIYLMGDSNKFFKEYNYNITVPFKVGVEKTIENETNK